MLSAHLGLSLKSPPDTRPRPHHPPHSSRQPLRQPTLALKTTMTNRNRQQQQQQQQQGENPWATLNTTGFGGSALPVPPPSPRAACPQEPNANPWATLNATGFSVPLPYPNSDRRTLPLSETLGQPPRNLYTNPQPASAPRLNSVDNRWRSRTNTLASIPEQGEQPSTLPVREAVNRLRDPNNIERAALQEDGSVVITREWVSRMVGARHVERAPSGNLVLARNSALRTRSVELGLHEGFVRWMTEADPRAEFGAGGSEIRIKREDARRWFQRE
ncbi:hypothetical protein K458DRAFT_403806 [Lentithecium fluviatile CBS 122367]|uniref:Uncharacterized protein n=1 Tax=Lentithecium fluviatile CBS 122367 TaxID=1168545 RepID=A0A6G1J3P5_9PLEO|nr:hypothetical protein K458DRAFT_403806 [Lentithecium fluviatile CBS 122367]